MFMRLMAAVVALNFATSIPAGAAVLQYNYTGMIDAVIADDTGQLATNGVAVGTAFSGSFAYDTASAPNSGIPGINSYPGISFSVQFASGAQVDGSDFIVEVGNDVSGVDFLTFQSRIASSANFSYSSTFRFHVDVRDSTMTAFSSLALPATLSLADFNGAVFTFRGGTDLKIDKAEGALTTLELAPVVPIPAALPLFASALVGFGLVGHRRRKAQAG